MCVGSTRLSVYCTALGIFSMQLPAHGYQDDEYVGGCITTRFSDYIHVLVDVTNINLDAPNLVVMRIEVSLHNLSRRSHIAQHYC